MKRVLFIVVTYNGMRWLQRCLDSVPAFADLYVFDNDSTDGSPDFVASRYPGAKLVRSAENLGFSKPNNVGFQYAIEKGYDYVYLLNQDAWLEPGSLEKLLAAAQAHPEYGVLSPLQYQDGYEKLDKQFGRLYKGGETQVVEVPRVMAAHWLVPVPVVEKMGLFEETLFPFYGQDDEWCQRLHFSGLKVGVCPQARAVHDRALRPEPLEKVVHRNFYTGSLVRLCRYNRSLFGNFLYVVPFTFVKALKYRSLLPFKYLGQIFRDLPAARALRSRVRARAHSAR